jgi:hypothetical protein
MKTSLQQFSKTAPQIYQLLIQPYVLFKYSYSFTTPEIKKFVCRLSLSVCLAPFFFLPAGVQVAQPPCPFRFPVARFGCSATSPAPLHQEPIPAATGGAFLAVVF